VDKLKRDRGSEEARHAHLHAANCVAPSRSSSSDVPFRCRIRGSSPLLTAALMSAEPHIRSPFSERLAPQSLILEVIGLGRVGPHCISAYRSHCLRRPARPDPTRLIRPRGTRDNALSPSRMPQTAFTTAPAGISPRVTYLDRAMSSLRASATIEMRRVRPRSEPTRWRNQPLRALSGWYLTHIQASSTIVVRRRGLPAFEIPCSWSMLPLFHELGARPA
jgi:hypothetical protein